LFSIFFSILLFLCQDQLKATHKCPLSSLLDLCDRRRTERGYFHPIAHLSGTTGFGSAVAASPDGAHLLIGHNAGEGAAEVHFYKADLPAVPLPPAPQLVTDAPYASVEVPNFYGSFGDETCACIILYIVLFYFYMYWKGLASREECGRTP
jgi:hypothetical protein